MAVCASTHSTSLNWAAKTPETLRALSPSDTGGLVPKHGDEQQQNLEAGLRAHSLRADTAPEPQQGTDAARASQLTACPQALPYQGGFPFPCTFPTLTGSCRAPPASSTALRVLVAGQSAHLQAASTPPALCCSNKAFTAIKRGQKKKK